MKGCKILTGEKSAQKKTPEMTTEHWRDYSKKILMDRRMRHTRGQKPKKKHECSKCGKELPDASKKMDHQRRCRDSVKVISVLPQEF